LCTTISTHTSVHHPHLPSFPTRRSSDLLGRGEDRDAEAVVDAGQVLHRGIDAASRLRHPRNRADHRRAVEIFQLDLDLVPPVRVDRKSTRLNSSHVSISYAVFCLKKKTH